LTSASLELFLDELKPSDVVKGLYRRYGLWLGWAAMATITLANVATLLASTIINVAIPEIMGTFGIGQDKAQWLATAFLASSTVTMLMNSWLIQSLGPRYTVVMAMLLFMGGSVLGGVSPNTELLTVARILQGSATGIITPMSMSMVFVLFPQGRQGMVIGVTSIGIVLAPAIGPALGGFLIDAFSWRYTYLLGVPFSILVVPMALLFLPNRDPNLAKTQLDWRGLVMVSLAISSLLIALSNGQREGWDSNFVLGWFATALVSGTGFVFWERHTPLPLLDLRVMGYYKFTLICVLSFVFGAGLYGSTYLLPLFLQVGQHLTATDSGLMMLPAALAMGVMFPISGRLSDRIDQRLLLGSGFLLLAFSSLLMMQADTGTAWWTLAWWLVIGRLGIGIMAPTLNLAAIQGLPIHLLQQGAGVTNFIRQMGGAFGVNLLSVLLDYRTTFHRDALLATQSWDHSDTFNTMMEIERQLVPAGLTFWENRYTAYGLIGQIVQHQSFVFAFQDCMLVLCAVFLATIVPLSMLRRRHMRTPR